MARNQAKSELDRLSNRVKSMEIATHPVKEDAVSEGSARNKMNLEVDDHDRMHKSADVTSDAKMAEDPDKVNSHSSFVNNCYISTTHFYIPRRFLKVPRLEPISEIDQTYNSHPLCFKRKKKKREKRPSTTTDAGCNTEQEIQDLSIARCKNKVKYFLIQNCQKANSLRKKRSRRIKNRSNSPKQEDGDFKKTILDLMYIYDSNPGLQRIERQATPGGHRNVLTEDSVAVLKDTFNVKRKHKYSIEPLHPKITRTSEKVRAPRDVNNRRLNTETAVKKNTENINGKEYSQEISKYTKAQNRFRKSEFKLLESLNHLSFETDSSVRSQSISVAEMSGNTGDSISQRRSPIGLSPDSDSQRSRLAKMGSSPTSRDTDEITSRARRIEKLYRDISRSKNGGPAILKPLDLTPSMVVVDIESDDD